MGMSNTPEKKRRLPMVQASEIPPEDEERPPWHWAAVAGVGAFVFWVPLIVAVSAFARDPGPAAGVLHAVAFALASALAGFVVGRFGGKAGKREATVGGAAAGALAWLAAITQGGIARAGGAALAAWLVVLVVIVALGAGASRAGAALGLARRR
jgi:tRNA-(ms[2]io[6]A)-hydroxylase